jgi:signal transduction protein with GAF and PtsI domain
MSAADTITVGLSQAANQKLNELHEKEIFAEKMDGYRFAVGLALAHGVVPPEITKRETLLNVGSLDPDQNLKRAVEALMPEELTNTTPYRLIERLAEWGISEMYSQAGHGDIDFVGIFDQLSVKAD